MDTKQPSARELQEQSFDARMRRWMQDLIFEDQLPDEGNYKKGYLVLYNGIASAIQAIEELDFGKARRALQFARQDAQDAVAGIEEEDDWDDEADSQENEEQ